MTSLFRLLRARRADRRRAALTLDAARARARRGADLLDDRDPGWHARIDATRLQLADGEACVIGQLWGGYRLGLGRSRVVDLSSAATRFVSPIDLGFQATDDLGDAARALDYAFLTRAWRELVADRNATPAPASRAAHAVRRSA